MRARRAALLLSACAWLPSAWASDADFDDGGALDPIVVRGSRAIAERWHSPAALEVISGDELRAGRPQISIADGLSRLPGLVVRERHNHAQDLQLSVRGFGSRASFGVRGLKLYVDGIPASAPDGQGQTSHFPIGAAERIEFVRGPLAALYGANSGGVLALTTEDGRWPGEWRAGFAAGSDGQWRLSSQVLGRTAPPEQTGWAYALAVSGFTTDGARPHSAATQGTANLKLSRQDADGRLVLLLNHHQGQAQDPLGLSRAEFDADWRQTTANALRYDSRKTVHQTQLGAAWERRLGAGQRLELIGWLGQRGVVQYQAIPPAAQAAPTSAGGVIDLNRGYGGINARWRLERPMGDATLGLVAGLSWSRQQEHRRGYENFIGERLGVRGRLRRDERNVADALEPYVQAEWRSGPWTLSGGLRHSRIAFSSRDHYIGPGNDDSGRVRFSGFSSVLGARVQLADALQLFGSIGGGLETPTLNEAAYSPGGQGGLNRALGASRHRSAEIGLRGRHGWGGWSATAFQVHSDNEIVPALSQGGRTTYQNAGRTRRHGLELALDAELGEFTLGAAASFMRARFRDGYSRCTALPCSNAADRVPAGRHIPGLPRQQLTAQLDWRPSWARGGVIGLEARHIGRVPVNDANTDFAGAATVFALSARHELTRGNWRIQPFLRIDNLGNRRHAGSVIVNEGNGRFFEPAPGRSVFVGLELRARH